jgi:predicted enzyme related to lactoylglutathione lyase
MEAAMVETRRVFGSFSVNDIEAARSFYGHVMGMELSDVAAAGPIWLHAPGGHDTLIYLKADHVPASFTVLNLSVNDIAQAIDELTARGVRFERFPGLETDERGVYQGAEHSLAWFMDPAGNTLSLVQED